MEYEGTKYERFVVFVICLLVFVSLFERNTLELSQTIYYKIYCVVLRIVCGERTEV